MYPRVFSHIGITVTDLDKAVPWYQEILGARVLMKPTVIREDESLIGRLCTDVFGKGFQSVRIAHLATADGIGLEMFQFDQPRSARRDNNFEYWKSGIFHFCMIDPDIEGLAKKIVAAGGRHRSQIWPLYPNRPYRMTYCEDPWGNILEIYTHSYEQSYSNQEY